MPWLQSNTRILRTTKQARDLGSNVDKWEKGPKCGSLPSNAGELTTLHFVVAEVLWRSVVGCQLPFSFLDHFNTIHWLLVCDPAASWKVTLPYLTEKGLSIQTPPHPWGKTVKPQPS